MDEITKTRSALDEKEKKREELTRAYTTLSMTASHVFRKAEKIATKQRHPAETSTLLHTIELLSDHVVPDPEELDSALARASPIAERMIAAEEITLKNKEERGIFSDTAQFRRDIRATCSAVETGSRMQGYSGIAVVTPGSCEDECTGTGKNPARTHAGKRKTGTKRPCGVERENEGEDPFLEKALREKIEGIIGKGVQLLIDDQMKV